MRIAVVGTGIAGNAAAYALAGHHELVVYEKETRAGGHAHTVDIDHLGRPIAVDTGFIVYNELNYPNLTALFARLGVETRPSDMSFAVSVDRGRREWKGGEPLLSGLFAMKRSIFSPSHLWMLKEIMRFNRVALADRAAGRLRDAPLGCWLAERGFRGRFVSDYIVPMGAAIWSTPYDQMLQFPAHSFVGFFANHRLVHLDRPVWRTVAGGSRSYVERMTAAYADRIRLGTGVARVERRDGAHFVTDTTGATERFDRVVFACHTDETLGILADATDAERDILGAVRYRPNEAILHRDPSLMPKRRSAWASWNVLSYPSRPETFGDVCVTYWMNALQGIPADRPLFVTLNPPHEPDPALVFRRFTYDHPQYDRGAILAQKRLDEIQGRRGTYFCGAWTGYGFHEDGLVSGLAVAERLGGSVPWRTAEPAGLERAA